MIKLIGLVIVLMIGAPSMALANQADREQEASIASDSKGRVCNFGPDHDECYDQFIKHGHSENHITEGVVVITYNVPPRPFGVMIL